MNRSQARKHVSKHSSDFSWHEFHSTHVTLVQAPWAMRLTKNFSSASWAHTNYTTTRQHETWYTVWRCCRWLHLSRLLLAAQREVLVRLLIVAFALLLAQGGVVYHRANALSKHVKWRSVRKSSDLNSCTICWSHDARARNVTWQRLA